MVIRLKCPNPGCGKEHDLPAELAGKTVTCDACRKTFQVPVPAKPAGVDAGPLLVGSEPRPAQPPVTASPPDVGRAKQSHAVPPNPEPRSLKPDPLIGTKIAHYRIESLLGQGGMGKVYKAHNTSLDKTCAIKILPQDFANQDQSNTDRFVREARSAAAIQNPNVLPVHFVGKVEKNYFIEMEYVDGGTLQGLLKKQGKLPVKEAARIIRDVAAGLQAAHEKGIIHRDIKPTNVMLTGKGHVFVMDFGLAKLARATTALTQQGYIVGTPLYMSPEQATSRPVDHRSDIYSLGVMFYQVVTGTPPFTADSPIALLYQHQHEPVPDIAQVAPEVPPHIAEMIRKMMAKNPAERYQSWGEIADELNGFLTTGGATVTVSEETLRDAPDHRKSVLTQAKRGAPSRATPKPTAGDAPKKRSAMPVALALVLLLVLVLGAVVYFVGKKKVSSAFRAQNSGTPQLETQNPPKADLGETSTGAKPETAPSKSPWDDVSVTTAATGEKIPHPLSRKTYKQTLPDGTTIDCPEGMVYVAPGEFTMGEKESEHKVYLDAYFIRKYEVTSAEWKVFCDIAGFTPPKHWKGGEIPQGKENHPVLYVSWEDVQKYCEWTSKETGHQVRLPTEAQWEKAARGPKGFMYPWGNEWDPGYCNWQGMWAAKYGLKCNPTEGMPSDVWNAFTKTDKYIKEICTGMGGMTTPIGSFPEGKCFYGCYDMAWNAYEWCQDWFTTNYYKLKDAKRNPEGPTEEQAEVKDYSGKKSKARVLRGGGWYSSPSICRTVYRNFTTPSGAYYHYGFRVAVAVSR